ncbi:GNAT family N-acetyltransferase [Propionimicrobium sp. PCR01-08-3]|uniref:GNAT family N-acetyltransferase n=1 Tax=Propionimicrobium sp. PCR01-08-3 TaxID=3052086 RepID=UPI00255CFF68|nr:GNAT family N-acetyltransferase [Propionimicrobium sp. PCR01-08-3]WIY81737.1 GNAT family N-acetyltransferase [Propionimicrobium sp. PCR01-08-3]
MPSLPPRPIKTSDDLSDFHCGEPALDAYLTNRALANHVTDLARCYVCCDTHDTTVLGYYTLSAIAIGHADLPRRVRRNAPSPVPAVLLGRLAVDREAHGSGLGAALLRDAILSTLAAAEWIGVRVLLVHALNEHIAAFYERFDFRPSPTDPLHLYLLLADARLSLQK